MNISNTECLLLFTGQLPTETKTDLVKWLTQSVFFNNLSITDLTQNQLSKMYNKECPI